MAMVPAEGVAADLSHLNMKCKVSLMQLGVLVRATKTPEWRAMCRVRCQGEGLCIWQGRQGNWEGQENFPPEYTWKVLLKSGKSLYSYTGLQWFTVIGCYRYSHSLLRFALFLQTFWGQRVLDWLPFGACSCWRTSKAWTGDLISANCEGFFASKEGMFFKRADRGGYYESMRCCKLLWEMDFWWCWMGGIMTCTM